MNPPGDSAAASYRDSRERRILLEAFRAVNGVITSRQPEDAFHSALRMIGEAAAVDCIYIYENSFDPDNGEPLMSMRYEWRRGDPEVSTNDSVFKNLTYQVYFSRWLDQLSRGRCIMGQTRNFPDEERGILEVQGIRSILVLPLSYKDTFWGFIGFDHRQQQASRWTEREVEALSMASTELVGLIEKNRLETRLQTARKRAEALNEELRGTNRQIERSIVQANQLALQMALADRIKSEFLTAMSHEIRTPMNAIIGFCEILKRQIRDRKQLQYLDGIYNSGAILLEIINDLLNLTRTESGKLNMDYRPCTLKQITNEVRNVFFMQAREKELQLETTIDERLDRELLLDKVRVRQILFNLTSNAIKFTTEGHVRIKATLLEENRDTQTLNILLQVEDTGCGISEENQRQVFDSWLQETTSRQPQETNAPGEHGLGLAIARKLVEMMNGRISLYSADGKGSVFSVYLPGIRPADTVTPKINDAEDADNPLDELVTEDAQFLPAKVLIADDNEYNVEIAKAFLQNTGLTILTAYNGRNALEIARRLKPDLILMDIQMPVMDGLEATRRLKQDESTRNIFIVLVTAVAQRMAQKRAQDLPIDESIVRPFERIELLKIIARFLPLQSGRELGRSDTTLAGMLAQKHFPESREAIAAFVARAREDFLPRVEKLAKVRQMNLIETFAADLEQVASETRCYTGQKFAQILGQSIESFKVRDIKANLEALPRIINQLENHLQKQNPQQGEDG